ncbi:unnamed protein product, partial [Cuscuta epithymum]
MAPLRKKSIDDSQSGEHENTTENKAGRVIWSKNSLHVLCDLCIKHVEKCKGKNGAVVIIVGKYYLVDKGYPERDGYLTPYPKTRYHQSEFRGANPRGVQEIFNRAHSSLRSCIERAFGVLK